MFSLKCKKKTVYKTEQALLKGQIQKLKKKIKMKKGN